MTVCVMPSTVVQRRCSKVLPSFKRKSVTLTLSKCCRNISSDDDPRQF